MSDSTQFARTSVPLILNQMRWLKRSWLECLNIKGFPHEHHDVVAQLDDVLSHVQANEFRMQNFVASPSREMLIGKLEYSLYLEAEGIRLYREAILAAAPTNTRSQLAQQYLMKLGAAESGGRNLAHQVAEILVDGWYCNLDQHAGALGRLKVLHAIWKACENVDGFQGAGGAEQVEEAVNAYQTTVDLAHSQVNRAHSEFFQILVEAPCPEHFESFKQAVTSFFSQEIRHELQRHLDEQLVLAKEANSQSQHALRSHVGGDLSMIWLYWLYRYQTPSPLSTAAHSLAPQARDYGQRAVRIWR
ncbi:hypothetical protein OIO90_004247 [Microbotryomycetes sp. JL221]|nr:hypothetical protein OIO90_004247 [Microbotryomycetes sp. JL221]